MSKKYLFISQNDLALEDSNGRTFRNVFNYVNIENIYAFSLIRRNEKLNANQVFYIDESRLFRKKKIHYSIKKKEKSNTQTFRNSRKIKKNPLTMLLRNLLWSISFYHWRHRLRNWLEEINVDYIIFNPGDFAFMHRLAGYVSKVLRKKIIVYNTEDYYFKTWNYLHDERGFKRLYPIFRKQLLKAYRYSAKHTSIAFHNTEELMLIYKMEFPFVTHYVAYHPTMLAMNLETKKIDDTTNFYYCGALDKGRDKTLLIFAKILKEIMPNVKIIVNGKVPLDCTDEINNAENIIYKGFIPYDKVTETLKQNHLLLSINSLEKYHVKDKKYGFSTKIADYIASLNLIFHIGVEGGIEINTIKKYQLGYVATNEEEIVKNLISLKLNIKNNKNPYMNNQKTFYENHLNYYKVARQVQERIEGIGNKKT